MESPNHPVARRRLLAWLPVVLWLALIFAFSTDAGSSRRTSRIIGPLLRWIHPGVSDEAINTVQTVVRKGAHVAEYAILAVLIWRALRRSRRGNEADPGTQPSPPPHVGGYVAAKSLRWSRRDAVAAIALTALCAGTDEWHQATVPSRQGQFTDVLIDTAGAILGIMALWSIGRLRKRW